MLLSDEEVNAEGGEDPGALGRTSWFSGALGSTPTYSWEKRHADATTSALIRETAI